jgi:hypothetical protein
MLGGIGCVQAAGIGKNLWHGANFGDQGWITACVPKVPPGQWACRVLGGWPVRRLLMSAAGFVAVAPAWAADLPAAEMPVKAPPPAAVVTQAWEATVASEVRYYSWKSDRGYPTTVNTASGSGSQIYVPVAMQIAGKPSSDYKVQFLVRGGWVHSHQSTAGLTGTVDTITDTVMSGSFTYLGINGIQPFVAVSLNAPTGKSALFGAAANARMDPDLVEVSSFGEGWNVGPSAGVNIPITANMMLTSSVGYTWRSAYDRERSTAELNPTIQTATRINPGDVTTGTVALGYQEGSWAWNVTGTVSSETATTENGASLYRPGLRYLGTGSVSYSWPEQYGQTTLTGSYAHSDRNDVLFLGAPALVKETMETNSDLYRVGVQHLVPVGDTFAFGPTASYLHRSHNGYDPGTLQFVPAKDRWSVGGQARAAATQNVTLNMRAEYIRTREDERDAAAGQLFSVLANAFVPGSSVPVVSSNGWMVAGGANVKF